MARTRKPTEFYITSSFAGNKPIEEAFADVYAYIIEKRMKSSDRTFEGNQLSHYNEDTNSKEDFENGTAA